MVDETISSGLKVALSKGESLKSAMMSFYNAGYSKQEIEEAARVVQMDMSQEQQWSIPQKEETSEELNTSLIPLQSNSLSSSADEIQNTVPLQRVSNYETASSQRNVTLLVVLAALLVVLLGILAIAFIFKTEIMDFLKNL